MNGRCHSTADGASLYWEEEGDGPSVLLVHGGTGTSAFDWEFVRERLARSYHLLLVDVRGHGRSSDPTERLSLEQIGLDVASLVEELAGCDAIIAFSVSASAVLALLCKHPSLTSAFVCIGASTAGDASQVPRFVNGPWPAELKGLRHLHGTGDDHWRRLRVALANSWARHRVTGPELRALSFERSRSSRAGAEKCR